MGHYNMFLPSYSIGPDSYREIPWVTRRYGKTAVVVGGKTAMEKAKAALLEATDQSDLTITGFVWYGGNSSYENVEALMENPLVKEADMVFAVGGGRAVDTCKILCEKIDKPIFAFPTIASNCAACTTICVVYHADDSFKEYFFRKQPAFHTFIHTEIIAQAPVSFLWAGIGDALSKEYECLFASRADQLDHSALMGTQLARICTAPLLEYGAKALEDCRRKSASYELEQTALTIIISTGLVSNTVITDDHNYNSSLAHCVYYGSTVIPSASKHLHGEIVSYGVLVLLSCDHQDGELAKLIRFNRSIGLPTRLSDLDLTPGDVPPLVQKAMQTSDIHSVPYPVSAEMLEAAILRLEEF